MSSIVICLGIIFSNILNVEARIPYTYLNIGGLTPDQQIDSVFMYMVDQQQIWQCEIAMVLI